jgi:hypothetical protein
MNMRRAAGLTVITGLLLILTSCIAGPNDLAGGPGAAGFWLGLWQGLISPITFIVSLFNDNVNIYDVHNNGNWYNLGFMLGVACVFSGGAGAGNTATGRRRSRRSER